jgi:hypothetical protein
MEELIQRLQQVHGLTKEQSSGILNTIAGYIKEKFPMIGGAVDNIFPASNVSDTVTGQANFGENPDDDF